MTDLFHSSLPIYEQIAELIQKRIIRGDISAGEKLPSVREMALEMNVNPNTVQRTYRELEIMKIVETKRGQGTFVTENTDVIDTIRNDMKKQVFEQFTEQMFEMGYTKEDIKRDLAAFLEKEGEES